MCARRYIVANSFRFFCFAQFLVRRANAARLRGMAVRYVNRICCYAYAHAFGMGAPHPPLTRFSFLSQHLTFGSSCTVIFDQVRKASLRIKILCQHNKCKAKSNSDHRNSISRERSPQARRSATRNCGKGNSIVFD